MSESQDDEQQKSGWWGTTLGKLKSALARTKDAVVDQIVDRGAEEQEDAPGEEHREQALPAFASSPAGSQPVNQLPVAQAPVIPPAPPAPPPKPARPIDDDYLEDLEEKLIRADLGLSTAQAMVEDLRKQARSKGWNSRDVEAFLKLEFTKIINEAPNPALKHETGKLNVYLVVGVNGTGKTTSIGKLCWRFKQQGRKVLMAAADTFRAAAETQLEIWSTRAGVDIVRLPDGSDPGAVVYQAIQKAKNENYDCLVIDTAGRLHNKTNLMAELKKVRTVVEKNAGDQVLESLLVLDASTGQNGLQQARVFTEVCPLTGVILTKLDGTAKGGVIFSIARDLKIPVKLIGLGEQIDDLRDFEPAMFVEALF
jgi:fused signal recognition particle receptor